VRVTRLWRFDSSAPRGVLGWPWLWAVFGVGVRGMAFCGPRPPCRSRRPGESVPSHRQKSPDFCRLSRACRLRRPGETSFHRQKSPNFCRLSSLGRDGRGSNRRGRNELAPILNYPRTRAIARVEMPASGVVAAGKPLGSTETGAMELGATAGWRRHINGMGGGMVHVEPLPECVKTQPPHGYFIGLRGARNALPAAPDSEASQGAGRGLETRSKDVTPQPRRYAWSERL
jgi:hypothetical protein